jgi:hypothetical protein
VVLAQLGAADFLPEMWAPGELTRALRRRIAHRSSLVLSAPGCVTRSTPCWPAN